MTEKDILKFLENMECDFDDLTSEDYEDYFYTYLGNVLKDYWAGATKLVLLFKDFPDYVIKIPFYGEMTEKEIYDEEIDDYYDSDWQYFPFENGGGVDFNDYCAIEKEIYKDAEIEDVNQLFAETVYIGSVGGHPIYKQEVCEIWGNMYCDENYHEIHSPERRKEIRDTCSDHQFSCFNRDWLIDVLDYYGEEIFLKFMYFIKDEYIRDLHDSNVGYLDGAPIIIDYAGYNS